MATDRLAIDLINAGLPWAGATSGKIEKVSVRVKFVK